MSFESGFSACHPVEISRREDVGAVFRNRHNGDVIWDAPVCELTDKGKRYIRCYQGCDNNIPNAQEVAL